MKKFLVAVMVIALTVSAFSLTESEVAAKVSGTETTAQRYDSMITEATQALAEAAESAEFRRLSLNLQNIGTEINWQYSKFREAKTTEEKQAILERMKEYRAKYDEAQQKLKEFQAKKASGR
jgi:predicted nuclease with TOPRIM domain